MVIVYEVKLKCLSTHTLGPTVSAILRHNSSSEEPTWYYAKKRSLNSVRSIHISAHVLADAA
jgi:hypothetical protein